MSDIELKPIEIIAELAVYAPNFILKSLNIEDKLTITKDDLCNIFILNINNPLPHK